MILHLTCELIERVILMKRRWIFKTVIYLMIFSMLMSTLVFAIDALL